MKTCVALLGFALLLSACGEPSGTVDSVPVHSQASVASSNPNQGGVIYAQYSDRLIGRGKSSVLFFFKASDPFSLRSERAIQSMYGSGSAVVSTYRLEYPTATGARIKYGVLVEDTLVLLDASGQRVASFVHPSAEEIRIILRGNIPAPKKP